MNKEDYKIAYENVMIANKMLEQENKQLKKQLEYLRSNEYLNQVKWERNFNEELVKDLQQRIDKAIEYMKNYNEFVVPLADIKSLILKEEYKKIIEILGGNNE